MSEESDKVTADSYGNVKVDAVKDECWMLRVPAKLAEAWQQAPEGTVLGELVFRKGGTTMVMNGQQQHQPGAPPVAVKPSLEVIVDPNISSEAPLPRAYSLGAMTKKIPTLHPFSRRPNGSIKIHGTITRTGNLQVIQDANYRMQCKTRILQSTVHNSRYVKTVEANQVVQQSQKRTAGKGFGQAIHQYGKRLLDQANQLPDSSKRLKFDPDQTTKSIVFELFTQQQYWTLKDLKVATGGRPEAEIRDVLREIGDYHRSGDHKSSWELRHEFQNTSAAAAAAAGSATDGKA
jgi:hypothetical protein